jgi:hypothetical protein
MGSQKRVCAVLGAGPDAGLAVCFGTVALQTCGPPLAASRLGA